MKMKKILLRANSSTSPLRHTIGSDDGAVAFKLATVSSGLFVERIQECSSNGRVIQATVFADRHSFQRWCDANSIRFQYPLVYLNLKRHGDILLRRAS
jgi:hypothetical protein